MSNQHIWRDLHPKVKHGLFATVNNVTISNGVAIDANGVDVTDRIDIKPKLSGTQVRRNDGADILSQHARDNGEFVFAFYSQSRTVDGRFPTLLKPDMARLMFIGTYTAWDGGRLNYENGRPMDKDGLHKLVDMSRKRFNEFYNRIVAENIVHVTENGDLLMNPSVFYRGGLKSSDYAVKGMQYTRMFRDTVRDLYHKFNGRALGQLALLYEVMPFINFSTNIIAYNAEVIDKHDVKPMSLEKLALLLDYTDSRRLKTALNRVRVDNQPVFGFFENPHDRRSYRIVVNPRAVYAGKGEDLGAISALFN